jgi:hypothetical protein
MTWFQSHVYVAAWASPLITLVGLLIRNTIKPAEKVNLSMIVIYAAFLTCLAAVLTPGIDGRPFGVAAGLSSFGFGIIVLDALWKR